MLFSIPLRVLELVEGTSRSGRDFGRPLGDGGRVFAGASAALDIPGVGLLLKKPLTEAVKRLDRLKSVPKKPPTPAVSPRPIDPSVGGTPGIRQAPQPPRAMVPLTVLGKSCFVAGTPLLTPEGPRPIESLRVGDLVLSRDEHDAYALVGAKAVEEVFERSSRTITLVVSGREIVTTAEHPFFVVGTGWRCAGELERGDILSSHEGAAGVVEGIKASDAVLTVYNLRVADWHTYFVGDNDWGFSVWAHNAEYVVGKHLGGGWYEILDAETGAVVKKIKGQQNAINEASDLTRRSVAEVAPLSNLDKAAEAASRFKLGQCDDCARSIAVSVGHDANATFVRIRTKGGIYANGYKGSIGETGFHVGIDVDGKAFDNLYHTGLAPKDYLQNFTITGEFLVDARPVSDFFENGVFNTNKFNLWVREGLR